MIDLDVRRQLFAEEVAAVANLRTPALVQALAATPRERFLRPGPWIVQADATGPRQTPDADARHVYHNYSMAIDPSRQLFNGSPAFVAAMIDALAVKAGDAVLHVGAGLGYYTALLAQIVGAAGHVTAVEVDHELAGEAARNLAEWRWVTVDVADATRRPDRTFDAIFINTGVTHPQDAWLDALVDGGRLLLPLTAAIPAMGSIGKGVVAVITKRSADAFDARVLTFTAIYSGVGPVRDAALNEQLGKALMRTPFPRLTRLRRDPHEQSAECWLHGSGFCLSMN